MKHLINIVLLFIFIETKGQNITIEVSSRYNIDTKIRQNRNFAQTNSLLEITGYKYSQNNPTDSSLCLLERYDSLGRILYKKDFHFYDKKAYEEYIYTYDSLDRLITFRQQNTYVSGSDIVILEYNKDNRVSKLISRDTLNYMYNTEGLIARINQTEYIYNHLGGIQYEIDSKDTNSTYYYDNNNCLTAYYIKNQEYTVLTNNDKCEPTETLVYYAKGRAKTNSLMYKINDKYEDGKVIESIFNMHRSWGNRTKVWRHTLFQYNDHGLLIKKIELKGFGKAPRITNYYYKIK